MESIYFRIINQKEFFALSDEIDQLPDPAERKARQELLDRIHSVIGDYDVHIREYEYAQHGKAVLRWGRMCTCLTLRIAGPISTPMRGTADPFLKDDESFVALRQILW